MFEPNDGKITVHGYQTASGRGDVHLFSHCPGQASLVLIDKGKIRVYEHQICRKCKSSKKGLDKSPRNKKRS